MAVRIVCLLFVFFAGIGSVHAQEKRKPFDFAVETFFLDKDTKAQILFPSSMPDTVFLIRNYEQLDETSVTLEKLHSDYLRFMDMLLRKYTFGEAKVPRLAAGIVINGKGFLKNRLFQIDISELRRVNKRDFGSQDILDFEDGKEVPPLRLILQNTQLSQVGGEPVSADERATFTNTLNEFQFGGGLIETMIDRQSSAASGNSGGETSSFQPTNEYVLKCRDKRLFGGDIRTEIDLGRCTGLEPMCRQEFSNQLDNMGNIFNACSKRLGSEYVTDGIYIK